MQLKLIANAMYASGSTNKVTSIFGIEGGSIGRDASCQMVLPDPYRRISRIQAQVYYDEDQFFLTNASASNPIYVNGLELRPGEKSAVRHGDEWRAGNYVITVLQSESTSAIPMPSAPAAAGLPAQPAAGHAAAHPPVPHMPELADTQAAGPFDDLLGSIAVTAEQATMAAPAEVPPAQSPAIPDPFASPVTEAPAAPAARAYATSADPFADLLAAPTTAQIAQAPSQKAHWQSHALIPDDFNPLALDGITQRNAEDPLQSIVSGGSVGDMFPERSVDAIFSPAGAPIEQMTRDPLDPASHGSVLNVGREVDPMALFADSGSGERLIPDGSSDQSAPGANPISNHTSELGAFFRPPTPSLARTPETDPSPAGLASGLGNIPGHEAHPPADSAAILQPPTSEVRPAADPAISLESLFDLDSSAPVATPELVFPTADIPPPELPAQDAAAPEPLTPHSLQQPAHQVHSAPEEPPVRAAPAPAPAIDTPASDAQQLLAAFKEGAGLTDCRYPESLTPELMQVIGKMLAASMQGCMDLLGSRASTKQEVRMAVTLINAEANNPLKFLPTGGSALAQMFGPKMPGFMSGPLAVENAYEDLQLHQAAMAAGTQAALQGLFERFDPQILEAQLESQGRHRSLFASQRQARLWELYRDRYEWLKEEVKNQSPASWGNEFHSAYTSETRKDSKEGSTK